MITVWSNERQHKLCVGEKQMSEAPKVSIIVPVYKVPEKYLRACVESCCGQTLKEIEVILVDDGSPDQCGTVCDEYAAKDARIKVIHEQNAGLSAARNTGFLSAGGEWIMFVDGDDWIEPEMCKCMYRLGTEENVQLVMCGIMKDYGHSSEKYTFYIREKTYRGIECKWLQQQLLVYNGNIAVAYAKLIRRSYLAQNGILHDEKLRQGAEGLEFNLRMFEIMESALFIDRSFYHYVYNENSISASHDERNHQYVITCFEKIKTFIESSENREALLPWLDNRLLYVIVTTAISGYFNPENTEPYAEKKRKFAAYCRQPIIAGALLTKNLKGLSGQRRVVLFMIKHKLYFALNLMGIIRKRQKQMR